MRQGTFDFVNTLREVRVINLDEIYDPYEKSKEEYFIFKIVKAQHWEHKKLDDTEYIALELDMVERSSDSEELDNNGRSTFKEKKLVQNVSLAPEKIWLLKNLCNALHISGKYELGKLAALLVGKKVKARVMAKYNKKIGGYFYGVNRFKEITKQL
jgi:hypothetical protein